MGDFRPPADTPDEFSDRSPDPAAGSTSSGPTLHHQQTDNRSYQPTSFSSVSQQQSYANPQHALSSQVAMGHSQGAGRSVYNMGPMSNLLPQQPYQQRQQYPANQTRSYLPQGPSSSPMTNQQHYEGQGGITINPHATQSYMYGPGGMPVPYYGPSSISPSPPPPTARQSNVPVYNNTMAGFQPGLAPGAYYPAQQQQQMHYGTQAQVPGVAAYLPQGPMFVAQQVAAVHHNQRITTGQPNQYAGTANQQPRGSFSFEQDRRPSIVRGPPRKPKQSGHAIWIGNLPPGTDLMSLVHHVCDLAAGVQSLFLISKSNCAFCNFVSEEACDIAKDKVHDSRFNGVRLVSRLRRNTVEGATGITAPTGPAAQTSSPAQVKTEGAVSSRSKDASQEDKEEGPTSSTIENAASPPTASNTDHEGPSSTRHKDRYFILKSVGNDDLEVSVQKGIWATQSHNEDKLNDAFANSDNVYLIFSANRSGEYFGYAKMASALNDDPAAAIEFAPSVQAMSSDTDLPKVIPTPANGNTPKGQIVDDSSRQSIFWEAVPDEDENAPASGTTTPDNANTLEVPGGGGGQQDGAVEDGGASNPASIAGDARSVGSKAAGDESTTKTWGKPFQLTWMSTTRVPFYRTKGLRNSLNQNREIKIARDGTELEPSTGRKLVELFHRAPQTHTPHPPIVGGGGGGVVPSGHPRGPPPVHMQQQQAIMSNMLPQQQQYAFGYAHPHPQGQQGPYGQQQ